MFSDSQNFIFEAKFNVACKFHAVRRSSSRYNAANVWVAIRKTIFGREKLCWRESADMSQWSATLKLLWLSQFMQKIFAVAPSPMIFRMNRNNNPCFGQKNSGFQTKSKLSESGWKGTMRYRRVPHWSRLHCLWKDLSASSAVDELDQLTNKRQGWRSRNLFDQVH